MSLPPNSPLYESDQDKTFRTAFEIEHCLLAEVNCDRVFIAPQVISS